MRRLKTIRALVYAGTLIALAMAIDAQAQWEYDPRTFPLLPAWCKHTPIYGPVYPYPRDPAEGERLRSTMGPRNHMHIHHYCRGLEQTSRALYFESTKLGRDALLRDSIREFDYVLDRVERDFFMLPEILTKKGENLLRLEEPETAIRPLNRALELKADYWPAYAALSDYYRDLGDENQAREWLQKGLLAAPQAKSLQRRLVELDRPKGKSGATSQRSEKKSAP